MVWILSGQILLALTFPALRLHMELCPSAIQQSELAEDVFQAMSALLYGLTFQRPAPLGVQFCRRLLQQHRH